MSEKSEIADQGNETTDLSAEIADLKAQLEKVNTKNRELVAEKQKAKLKAQEALDAADEAATQAAERNGDIEALKAAHAKELQKLQSKLDAVDGDLRTVRVDNEIARAIAEGNVRSEMSEVLTGYLKGKVQYENGLATIEGTPLAEYATTYINSDIGAHFRRAADNNGAGATGNTSTATPTKLTKRPSTPQEWDYLDSLDTGARNALCDAINAPDLKV